MAEIKQTKRAATVLKETVDCCKEYRHEFIMPEHLLMVLIDEFSFGHIFNNYADLQTLAEKLEEKLEETEVVPEGQPYDPEVSALMSQVMVLERLAGRWPAACRSRDAAYTHQCHHPRGYNHGAARRQAWCRRRTRAGAHALGTHLSVV